MDWFLRTLPGPGDLSSQPGKSFTIPFQGRTISTTVDWAFMANGEGWRYIRR